MTPYSTADASLAGPYSIGALPAALTLAVASILLLAVLTAFLLLFLNLVALLGSLPLGFVALLASLAAVVGLFFLYLLAFGFVGGPSSRRRRRLGAPLRPPLHLCERGGAPQARPPHGAPPQRL